MQNSFAWLRKSALYIIAAVFLVAYPFTQFFALWYANFLYGVSGVAHAGNATGAEIAAGQLAGSGVQLGPFLTKLWIALVFFILFNLLPWLVQAVTHPAPTEWAKTDYKTEFKALTPEERFAVYGRLQLILTLKILGAFIASVLIV